MCRRSNHGPRSPGSCGQSGSVSVLMIACLILLLTLGLFTADVGRYIAAKFRAQDAADAAALAAVQESFPLFTTGAEPETVANRLASLNGASIERIEVSAGGGRVMVETFVEPSSMLLSKIGLGPGVVRASAAAEVDIDAILASDDIWFTGDPSRLSRLKNVLLAGPVDKNSVASMVVLLALQHLGKPYVWGATGPGSFDCSGLVFYVYAQIGVRLPRVTFSQVRVGIPVTTSELQPGDLVFFRGNAHVGIYVGGGCYIHAPHTGDVVKISPLGGRSVSACRRVI